MLRSRRSSSSGASRHMSVQILIDGGITTASGCCFGICLPSMAEVYQSHLRSVRVPTSDQNGESTRGKRSKTFLLRDAPEGVFFRERCNRAKKKSSDKSDEGRKGNFSSPLLSYTAPGGLRQAPSRAVDSHELAALFGLSEPYGNGRHR